MNINAVNQIDQSMFQRGKMEHVTQHVATVLSQPSDLCVTFVDDVCFGTERREIGH